MVWHRLTFKRSESILIFDDVADTGESLELAKSYLENHGTKNIQTATIYQKPWSKVKPDFVADDTKAWVIFPHDAIENMKLLLKRLFMIMHGNRI